MDGSSLGSIFIVGITVLLFSIFLLFLAVRVLTFVYEVAKTVLTQIKTKIVHQALHEIRVHNIFHVDLLDRSGICGSLCTCGCWGICSWGSISQ